jgi:hypothetical protein
VPDAVLWELTSMGTLVAFMVVSTGVIVLRHTRTDMPRGLGQDRIIAALPPDPPVTGGIADGKTWKAAFASIQWQDCEIIAVGSSHLGPLLRVFLGSNAARIVREATVPRMILPRQDG